MRDRGHRVKCLIKRPLPTLDWKYYAKVGGWYCELTITDHHRKFLHSEVTYVWWKTLDSGHSHWTHVHRSDSIIILHQPKQAPMSAHNSSLRKLWVGRCIKKVLKCFNDLIAVSLHFVLILAVVYQVMYIDPPSTLLPFLLVQSVSPRCIVASDNIKMKFKRSH